jgi:hypothetical protein
MSFGLVSVLVALLAAVASTRVGAAAQPALYRDCSLACLWECSSSASTRFQVSITMNMITMNMDKKLGLETAASNAIGWVLAGVVIGLVHKP